MIASGSWVAGVGPDVDQSVAGEYRERVDPDAGVGLPGQVDDVPGAEVYLTRPARALGEALQTDPSLFAEILSYVYFAEGESRDQEVPPERLAIAEAGYSAISAWRTPPGVRSDGTVDTERLRAWVTEARRLLAESGLAAVGDIAIGQVLAHVPPDTDGLWPGEPVRDLVEDLASQKFEVGLYTGNFNSRGIVTWSMTEGGEQERGLAAQYRASADRVADRWQRTGALLRQMAASYAEWARREDDEFEDFGNLAR